MAWAPDYCTTAELKSWLRITSSVDDTLLAVATTTASRAVDGYCGRQFGNISMAADRYYTWDGGLTGAGRPVWPNCRRATLAIDDIYTTTDLVVAIDTDGDGDTDTTLTVGTDFDLEPVNAAADGRPWTRLTLRSSSAALFTLYPNGVKVTARFGWAAVPTPIKQATIILAAELSARRNAPFGVAGSPELGSEMRLLAKVDPDAVNSLRPYVRALPGGWVAA